METQNGNSCIEMLKNVIRFTGDGVAKADSLSKGIASLLVLLPTYKA